MRRGRRAFVVAPDGRAGGGMGRVKDVLVATPPEESEGWRISPLVTRGAEGAALSLVRVASALGRIAVARVQRRVDVVHVNLGDRGSALRKGLLIVGARAIGVPVVLHLHAVTLDGDHATAPGWLRALIRPPFRAATRVIVLGERWRRWVVEELGIAARRVEIVWNGVPVTPPAAPRAQRGGPLEILVVGNLLERKGVSDLLAALASLEGSRWSACFVGGGDVPRYRALAQSLGLPAERVVFTGWVDHAATRAAIAAADLLVLPSHHEGLPLVILEALGLGTPVVCTPVGAIPEVLIDGETALFCRAGDVASIAGAIGTLRDDPALRARLSSAGIARFEAQFSAAAFRRAVFAVWDRAVSAR